MSMVTADYYYPDWECLVDLFCNPGLKIAVMGVRGLKQLGAYDLSATPTLLVEMDGAC